MTDAVLYEDGFVTTTSLTQTYDRVDRISATSLDGFTKVTLDVNSELYPIHSGENFTIAVASTLNLDGTKDEANQGWRGKSTEGTLADGFDYVTYGKVYRVEDEGDGEKIKVYVSFGGLLCMLEGPYKKLSPLKIEYVYMLLRK